MGCDHALAEAVGAGVSPPVFRLYAWDPPAVSLGWGQPAAERRAALEALARRGYRVVRRPTGGAAVVHDVEVTHAVTLPATRGLRPREACARVHAALLRGLERLGLRDLAPASAAPPPFATARASAAGAGTLPRVAGSMPAGEPPALAGGAPHAAAAACFSRPSASEITWRGRKLVGSAQRRLAGAFLQHGAVPLEERQDVLEDVWGAFDAPAASIGRAAGRSVGWAELADALVAGVAETFGADLRLDDLSAAEAARARHLAREVYASAAFTYRI